MAKKKPQVDPHHEREVAKYGTPIPSREFILATLRDLGRLIKYEELTEVLELTSEYELEALQRRLRAMERDGQVLRTRRGGYGLPDKMDLLRGRVMGHSDGYGFFIAEGSGEKYFLSERQMREVFPGDKVMARLSQHRFRGRKEAIIVEVLERNTLEIVGRYQINDGVRIVVPENKQFNLDILIPPDASADAQPGQMVVVAITSQPNRRSLPVGQIKEVLGEHMDPGMEIDVAIRGFGLPYRWPEAVIDEMQSIGTRVTQEDKQDREDLKALPFVTIDGEDAKDFDDAVYCQAADNGRGWILYVAIADVAHYVKVGSALDKEAYQRGNSVYFPGRVVPMLPAKLSNGLCSLKPRVDRLAMVCKIQVTAAGKVQRYEFFPAVIRSQARLTYTKVAKMLVDNDAALGRQYANLLPHLQELYALYQVLHHCRQKRGALDFEIPETRIVFGANRKIARIEARERNDAHRLIEECMLLANVCTAKFLLKHEMPSLYRNHLGPEVSKLEELRDYLRGIGLRLGGGKKPKPAHYNQVISSVVAGPLAASIQLLLLRSLSQAVYHADNEGHFGLAYDSYTHFTSPIRRYPDLLIHRAIKHLVQHKPLKKFAYNVAEMNSFGEHCSMTERRADEATRDVVDWLKCEFMLDKVGQVFTGKITSVLGFGLFVALDDIFVEGLVHVSSLVNDYYHYDAAQQCLTGERSGQCYRLGNALTIRVARVSLDDRKIDFDLVDAGGETRKASKKKRRKKSKRR